MKRRMALGLAGISIILLASFALVPPALSTGSMSYRYVLMMGTKLAALREGRQQ